MPRHSAGPVFGRADVPGQRAPPSTRRPHAQPQKKYADGQRVDVSGGRKRGDDDASAAAAATPKSESAVRPGEALAGAAILALIATIPWWRKYLPGTSGDSHREGYEHVEMRDMHVGFAAGDRFFS